MFPTIPTATDPEHIPILRDRVERSVKSAQLGIVA